MSGYEVLQSMRDKLVAARAQLQTSQTSLAHYRQELIRAQAVHLGKVDQVANDTQASEVVKVLFDKVSEKGFKFLEQLGTQALQIVFPDEVYTFKISIGSRGTERTVEFFINDGSADVPLTETGGGIQVLISFVFRVYFIMRNNLRPFIVMDEAFIQLSPQYQDTLLEFLQMLCDKFKFTIIWISHSPYLEGRVTKFYEMVKGRLIQR